MGRRPTFDRTAAAWPPARPEPPAREVWLLQRSPGKPGAGLGKTTGWIHRATLKVKQVQMLGGVEYLGIDDDGLHIRIDGERADPAGRPRRDLRRPGAVRDAARRDWQARGKAAHLIGGADVAAELDAKRAIDQGSRAGGRAVRRAVGRAASLQARGFQPPFRIKTPIESDAYEFAVQRAFILAAATLRQLSAAALGGDPHQPAPLRGFGDGAKRAAEPPPSPVRHAGSRRSRRLPTGTALRLRPAQRSKEFD